MAVPNQLPGDLARLLAELPCGVLHSTNEIIDYVNPMMASILGEPAERLIGRKFLEFVGPSNFDVVEQRYWARQRGEAAPRTYEMIVRQPSGRELRVEVEPRAVGTRELLLIARDISDRMRDSALLAALSEVALRVQRARTVPDVLAAACDGLRQLKLQAVAGRVRGTTMTFEHVAIRDEALAALERRYGAPFVGAQIDVSLLQEAPVAMNDRRAVSNDALSRHVIEMVRKVRPDADVDALEAELVAAGFAQSVVCPIVVGKGVWGVLAIIAETITSADAAALGLFASKVGSAIENAQTIQDLESKNRELATIEAVANAGGEAQFDRLLAQLLRIAAVATASDSASMHVLDADRAELRLVGTHGGRGVVAARHERIPLAGRDGTGGESLRTRAMSVGRDLPAQMRHEFAVEGFQELAVVPLLIKGRLAGMLSLGRTSARPYGPEELASAERLAAQIAIQVENARLYDDVRRRVRLLSVLFDLSRLGAQALEVAPLVERALEKVHEAIPAEVVALHLLERDTLVLAGKRGEDTDLATVRRLRLDDTYLCALAARERRTAAADLRAWPREGAKLARKLRVSHAVAVPLLAQERLIGTFCLVRRADRPFDEEEVRLIESSAAQVAMAIEHARLFEQERGRVEDLKLFLDVSRMITASLDLEQILEASATNMARVAEATHAFICLREPGKRILRGVATSDAENRDHFRTVRLDLDTPSVVKLAIESRSPVRVADAAGALGEHHWLLERYRQKSILALPLLLRDEPIGAVVISDSDRTREWTDAQIERATVVGGQVAVAVANARLYEDLKGSYEKLARTQAELVKRERLAALGELSAVVAHEVRNPLGVIFNSLGSLRRVLKPTGDAAMLLDIVGEEADRLNRIVGDLLDFARPNEPAIEPAPLEALLSGVAAAATGLAAGCGVEIEVDLADPAPAPPVDARMMRQAVLNLVINAIQAMPRGGKVTLRATSETVAGRDVACIEVRDTGPGVPAEIAERIFQPFFTTKASGTGLGLAVVKRIVEAHQGELALESVAGSGARFVIRLPLEVRR